MKRLFLFLFLFALVGVGVYLMRHMDSVKYVIEQVRYYTQDSSKDEGTASAPDDTVPVKPPPRFNLGPFDLPDGFDVSVYARGLEGPRVMTYGPSGHLLVSLPKEGKIVALIDRNYDGTAETKVTVIEGLNNPHGMSTRCDKDICKFYIAESDTVAEYDFDEVNIKAKNRKVLFDLPDGGGHSTRTIMFMPSPDDTKMLVSVGSSCNVCNELDDRRAKILAYDFKTGVLSTYAEGLRNSVFMAIHPIDGSIWATEMGRDNLGDDLPPDEINIIKKGQNYGWPICYGQNIHDTEFDKNTYIQNPCNDTDMTPAHIDIDAHSAPLGIAFFGEEGWPEEYWYNALVAYHGSWNSSVKKGYKIVRMKLDEKGQLLGEEDFITGFLEGDTVVGRPVDILIQPGGKIFVSDDKAGVIYKFSYKYEETN